MLLKVPPRRPATSAVSAKTAASVATAARKPTIVRVVPTAKPMSIAPRVVATKRRRTRK